jgi:hypothetical protein
MTAQQKAEAKTAAGGANLLSEEERSKDTFFAETAALANAMIAAHGREFAMGTLVLAARFIAENKALSKSETAPACGCDGDHGDHHDHDHHHKT